MFLTYCLINILSVVSNALISVYFSCMASLMVNKRIFKWRAKHHAKESIWVYFANRIWQGKEWDEKKKLTNWLWRERQHQRKKRRQQIHLQLQHENFIKMWDLWIGKRAWILDGLKNEMRLIIYSQWAQLLMELLSCLVDRRGSVIKQKIFTSRKASSQSFIIHNWCIKADVKRVSERRLVN